MTTNRFPNVGITSNGRDFNFFEKLPITATTFGGTTQTGAQPDMIITFPTQGVQMLNLGSGVLEYSFNGTFVHGELNSANASVGLTFDGRTISKIWFRVQAGSSGPINVSVQAWGKSG
jgi:hypothetical protein